VLTGKIAKECTKAEIENEVWEQLKRSFNKDGHMILSDTMRVATYLDEDIQFTVPMQNTEPLLVNVAGSWAWRPYNYTAIKNLVLAGDYTRTNTDLATMEGANESGKHAANVILFKTGYRWGFVRIHKMYKMPRALVLHRVVDGFRFAVGLPWSGHLPAPLRWAVRKLIRK
jgi:15-cis-phytoene desaturase